MDIIIGPMFSGKTSELIRRLTIFADLGLKVLYINHEKDTRSSDNISTHNTSLKTNLQNHNLITIKTNDLSTVRTCDFDVVGVDEAQMFQGLKEFALKVVETEGKRLIVCGLNGDFKRELFGEIHLLVPLCDTILKLFPYCIFCRAENKLNQALFSKRTCLSSDKVLIGGSESYIPVCRECYLKN